MKWFSSITILTLLVTALCDRSAYSQKLPFRSYSIEQGLSESVVYDMHQDRDGYMWIGTGFGLNRFDGIRMLTYFQQDGLADNHVHTITEDDQSRLWIGTESGVSIVEGDTIRTPDWLRGLNRYAVISITWDQQGDWWFGTGGDGVWLLDREQRLTQYTTLHGMGGDQVRDVIQTDDGLLWFATDGGLTRLDEGNFTTFTAADGLPGESLQALAAAADGRIWIGTESGLSLFDGNRFENHRVGEGPGTNSILSITLLDASTAWLGTESGAFLFKDGAFTHYTTEQGLSSDIIHDTLVDREGIVWFGTMGGGVNLFLGDYFHNYSAGEGLTSSIVTGFEGDSQGHFWVATYGRGIFHYDGTSSFNFEESSGLIDNRVLALHIDPDDRVWIGTPSGISLFERGQFREPPPRYQNLGSVRTFYSDAQTGGFWIGTDDRGAWYVTDTDVHHFDETHMLPHNSVTAIQRDREDRVWIATYGGLVVLEDGQSTLYTLEDGLPSNGVTDILIDQAGDIWVTTLNGLARIDGEGSGRQIETFPSYFDIVSTPTYFIFQDREGTYWIASNIGLIRFDYERYQRAGSGVERHLSFELVNQEQGLIANELNPGTYYIDREGTVWLGTIEGVSRFFPERYPRWRIPPVTHFNEIMVAGESVTSEENITRTHDRNFVQIEFATLSFAAPSQVLYEYRLEGVDDSWTRSYRPFVRYPSLAPGDYSFQLRAYNVSGVPGDMLRTFDFKIDQPFWMQWWFMLVMTLIMLLAILFIYHYYRIRRLVDIERMRVQIASDLHDDVGASLTELALQTDFLRAGQLEESVDRALKQIGEQSRRVVSTLDDIVWSIDARNDTVGDLTDRMQDHVNRVLIPRGMEVNYHMAHLDAGQRLPVQLKENLYLIFKESVNNIAKHSNADRVDITLALDGRHYRLEIKDNGTLKNSEVRRSGQGLRNIDMRAKRMNANAVIDREEGFTVTISGELSDSL